MGVRGEHEDGRGRVERAVVGGALDLILYAGKGGVGKTTVAAATAQHLAESGCRTLLVSVDPAHSLADVLQLPSGVLAPAAEDSAPTEVSSHLFALELDARAEVQQHWARIHDYLERLFVHQGVDAGVASELATLPGAYELAALLAVDRELSSDAWDLVVLDCAPTASALRMTTLPDVTRGMLRVVLGALRGMAGVAHPLAERLWAAPLPDALALESVESLLYQRLTALRQRLVAPSTAVRLVVTPERLGLDEARRAYTDLCLFELGVDAVVINRVLSEVDCDTDVFLGELARAQGEVLREIEEAFPELAILQAPLLDAEATGAERLRALGRALFSDTGAAAWLSSATAGLRFGGPAECPTLCLPLPGVQAEALDLVRVGDALILTTPRRRRAIPLPRRLARRPLAQARLEGGMLEVAFGPAPEPAR